MRYYKTDQLSKFQASQVMEMWNDEYPDFLAYSDLAEFESYLGELRNSEHHLAQFEDKIVGWIVKFDRDGGKWFILMVESTQQKGGIGSRLLDIIKRETTELNGWVILEESYRKRNGESYRSPIGFYKKIGFVITDEILEHELFSAVKVKWTKNPS